MMTSLRNIFSSRSDDRIDNSRNPWAGLASYEDPDKAERPLKFCGRDNESFDMAQLIDDNIFVTLYGKSGTGKTSLLNAGVFPRLRREQYLPVSIRLGMDAIGMTFQQCISKQIEQAIAEKGLQKTIEVVPLPHDDQATEYLWSLFARSRFIDGEGRTLFPVLVFDQFEEVFRDRRKDAEALLRQIHYMMDESHAVPDTMVAGVPYTYDFNFRFVLSIREDDLYRLEDSIDRNYLSAMKRCRYRLRSLSEDGARQAVLVPGKGLFRPGEEQPVADKIISIARNAEDGTISTNLLSLVCSRLYVERQRQQADAVSLDIVNRFVQGNPFERFYNEATSGLSNRQKSYIEDHLVDSSGRRNSISESDFRLHVKGGERLLEGNRKILQRTSVSSDAHDYRIELIHDSFCAPLARLQQKRRQRQQWMRMGAMAAVVLLSLGTAAAFYSQMQEIKEKQGRIEQQDVTIEDQVAELEMRNKQLEQEKAAALAAKDEAVAAKNEAERAKAEAEASNNKMLLAQGDLRKSNKRLEQETANALAAKKRAEQAQAETEQANTRLQATLNELKTVTQEKIENRSRFIAARASELNIGGNNYLARLIAPEILPTPEHPDIPHTTQAESFIREAWNRNDIPLCGHTKWVNYASFSPDGRYIASGSSDNTVKIWSVSKGDCLRTLKEHRSAVSSVSFSPDGRTIVSSSYDNTIKLWDTESGKCLTTLEGHTSGVCCAAFSPDGRTIVSASGDNTIKLWDAASGSCLRTLDEHTDVVRSAAFSPDGRTIVSASDDETIKLWDSESGKCLTTLEGHTSGVCCASFSPDGRTIVSASDDKTIKVWDASSHNCLRTIEKHLAGVNSVSFSLDGKYVISASDDGTISMYETHYWDLISKVRGRHAGTIKTAFFSPDGRYVVSASWDNTVRMWSLTSDYNILSLQGHTDEVMSSSFSPDGHYIVSASEDGTVKVWNALSGQCLYTLNLKLPPGNNSASFSSDGRYIVSASSDSTVKVWDALDGQCLHTLKGHNSHVWSASFSPDGRYIVSASSDSTVKVWDALDGQCLHTLKGHNSDVWSASFSSDGRYIVSASDSTVTVWDALDGQCLHTLKGQNGHVWSASFNSDGRYIVSTSDEDIKVWDASNFQLLHTLKGHTKEVFSAKFSPDSRYIVSASRDGTIKVWSFLDEICLVTLVGHKNRVYSASFSSDGRYIVSSSMDKTVKVWEWPTVEELLERTRKQFHEKGRTLTPEERHQYYLD